AVGEHRRSHGDLGREPVVRRAALALVVQAMDGTHSRAARAVARGHRHVEPDVLVLPVRIEFYAVALDRVRRVEVRALDAERRAEEPAYRQQPGADVRGHVEGVT